MYIYLKTLQEQFFTEKPFRNNNKVFQTLIITDFIK